MKIMNNNTYGWKHLFLISYFKHNTTLYAHTHTQTHTCTWIWINKLVKSWWRTVLTQNGSDFSKLVVWLSYMKHVNISIAFCHDSDIF